MPIDDTNKGAVRVAKFSRKEHFSASHRLFVKDWTQEENELIYGKCSGKNGHGHNYVLEVSEETGQVCDLEYVKQMVNDHVLRDFDHKNLDLDVSEFFSMPSTTENLAIVVWERLRPHLGPLLYKVTIHETDKNKASYKGY